MIFRRFTCRMLGHAAEDCTVTCFIDEIGIRTWTCPRCGDRVYGQQERWGWLVRDVHHSQLLPRGYGIAWINWRQDKAVCLPIPLNSIVGFIRKLWYWCKYPRMFYNDSRQAYNAGLEAGKMLTREKS